MTPLKPCPFCSSPGELRESLPDDHKKYQTMWYVGCTKCTCTLEWDADKSVAIEAWNTRAGEQAGARMVSESDFDIVESMLGHLADYHSWAGQDEESLDVKEFIAKLRNAPVVGREKE